MYKARLFGETTNVYTVHKQFELIRSINNKFKMKQLNLTKIADANNTGKQMCVLRVPK